MSQEEARPHCSIHGGVRLERIEGNLALTRLQLNPEGGATFLPSSGIPLVAFYCPVCGNIQIYHHETYLDYEYSQYIREWGSHPDRRGHFEYVDREKNERYVALQSSNTIQVYDMGGKIKSTSSVGTVDSCIREMMKISGRLAGKWVQKGMI